MLKIKIAAIVIFGVICASLGAYGWHKTHDLQPVERIVIKEVEKPVFKYIKQVDTNDIQVLRDWYNSPLRLEHSVKGSNIFVRATDGIKQTDAVWQISETPNYKVYVGVAVGAAILAAYGTYKILR